MRAGFRMDDHKSQTSAEALKWHILRRILKRALSGTHLTRAEADALRGVAVPKHSGTQRRSVPAGQFASTLREPATHPPRSADTLALRIGPALLALRQAIIAGTPLPSEAELRAAYDEVTNYARSIMARDEETEPLSAVG